MILSAGQPAQTKFGLQPFQGEFLPGPGAEVGMLDFEAKLMESNLDDGVNGEYNSKGSTTVKKDQSQQLATLGHHVLSLTVKDVQEKK